MKLIGKPGAVLVASDQIRGRTKSVWQPAPVSSSGTDSVLASYMYSLSLTLAQDSSEAGSCIAYSHMPNIDDDGSSPNPLHVLPSDQGNSLSVTEC